jgi:hypothetical protein
MKDDRSRAPSRSHSPARNRIFAVGPVAILCYMGRQHDSVITSSWVVATAASLALVAWNLPYALLVDAASAGFTALYALVGLLVVQGVLCAVWWLRWWRIPLRFLVAAVLAVSAAHVAVDSVARGHLAHELWRLWIGPAPMVIAAAIQLVLVGVLRTRSHN